LQSSQQDLSCRRSPQTHRPYVEAEDQTLDAAAARQGAVEVRQHLPTGEPGGCWRRLFFHGWQRMMRRHLLRARFPSQWRSLRLRPPLTHL
jgi:hypothetical protein